MNNNIYYDSRQQYMHTANAIDFSEDIYESYAKQKQEDRGARKVMKGQVKQLTIHNLAKIILVFALATAVVGQYVYIQNLGYSITREENQLNGVLSENEKLKQQYACLGDLAAIEAYAVNDLGMVKSNQTMFYVAENKEAEETVQQQQDGVFSSVINGVLGVLHSY